MQIELPAEFRNLAGSGRFEHTLTQGRAGRSPTYLDETGFKLRAIPPKQSCIQLVSWLRVAGWIAGLDGMPFRPIKFVGWTRSHRQSSALGARTSGLGTWTHVLGHGKSRVSGDAFPRAMTAYSLSVIGGHRGAFRRAGPPGRRCAGRYRGPVVGLRRLGQGFLPRYGTVRFPRVPVLPRLVCRCRGR